MNRQLDQEIKARLREFCGELRNCRKWAEDELIGKFIQREPISVSLPNNLESAP